jgi:hypothetical protein
MPAEWCGNPQGSTPGMILPVNVYAIEDDLFRCIGRSKRREFALDLYAPAATLLLSATIVAVVLLIFSKSWVVDIIDGLLVIGLMYFGINIAIDGLKRIER